MTPFIQPSRATRPPFILSAALLALAAALVWALPGPRPNAVFGRLDYPLFWLAVSLSALAACAARLALLPAARRGLAARRLALAWMAALLALGLAEAAAWLLPARHQMDNPWYLAAGGGTEGATNLPFTRPAHLAWQGLSRGDLALLNEDDDPAARTVAFQTDFEGFRNTSDKTRAELLVLGDSFAEAGNVAESETFAALVAGRLGLAWRNLGRAGYSTPAELVVLRQHGLPCRPGVAVWQIAEPNDLAEALEFQRWLAAGQPRYFDLARKGQPTRIEAWRRRSPTRRIFAALRRREPNPWPFGGLFRAANGQDHEVRFLLDDSLEFPAAGHPGWPAFADALARGAGLCNSNDIRLLVLLIPSKFRVMGPFTRMPADVAAEAAALPGLPEPASLAAQLRPLCQSLDLPFLDATPDLMKAAAAGSLVYLPLDTHLSPAGHAVVADRVVDQLRPMLSSTRP